MSVTKNNYAEEYVFSITYLKIKNSIEEISDSDISSSESSSDDDFEALAISPRREAALEVLGLPRDATDLDIKKQYHTLARELHPDRNVNKTKKEKEENEERFKNIQNAFDILMKKLIKLKF